MTTIASGTPAVQSAAAATAVSAATADIGAQRNRVTVIAPETPGAAPFTQSGERIAMIAPGLNAGFNGQRFVADAETWLAAARGGKGGASGTAGTGSGDAAGAAGGGGGSGSWKRRGVSNEEWDRAMARVQNHGNELIFLSDAMRADREIVLAAVRQNGLALEYAVPKLRADREVVLTAIQRNALALRHASEKLRADRAVGAGCSTEEWPDAEICLR